MSDTKKQELLQQLEDCVLEMEDDTAAAVAQEYVAAGYSAYEGIMDGLCRGMEKAGRCMRRANILFPKSLAAPMPCMLAWKFCVHISIWIKQTKKQPSSSESWREIPTISAKML